MTSDVKPQAEPGVDTEMRHVLDDLLARDEDITARAVARLHPRINAASSVTRSASRSQLLSEYQQRQTEFRRWSGRLKKMSGAAATEALASRDARIAELETQITLLTASHVAMIRAVGELGGFGKWAMFFERFRDTREQLKQLGALPEGTRDSPKDTSLPKVLRRVSNPRRSLKRTP